MRSENVSLEIFSQNGSKAKTCFYSRRTFSTVRNTVRSREARDDTDEKAKNASALKLLNVSGVRKLIRRETFGRKSFFLLFHLSGEEREVSEREGGREGERERGREGERESER